MEKLTVLQLSKRTGLSRTQIYHLQAKNKIKIINGKIDLEEAMPAIIELLDKKSNKDGDVNFKQILNLLISQNILLQTQLHLAHEREKSHLTELASYRQSLVQKTTLQPSTDESNTQTELENGGVDTDENSLNKMESESETQAPIESHQNINKETKSVNKTESHPYSTESNYNEMTEQNDDALVDKTLPNQDDTEPSLNLNRPKKTKAPLAKTTNRAKPIRHIPLPSKRTATPPTDQPMTDQNDINKKDHHDYEKYEQGQK